MNQAETTAAEGGGEAGASASRSRVRAAGLVCANALGRIVRGKRALVLLLITLLPLLLGLAWNTVIVPPETFGIDRYYMTLASMLFLQLLLPLTSLALAAGLISDEVDRGTLLYLFTRPVPKGAILAGKFAAYLVVSTVILGLSFLLLYGALRMQPDGGALADAGGLAPYFLILLVGLLPYGSLITLAGIVFRKPMIPVIVFTFGWEGLVANLPGQTRLLTLTYYLRILLNRLTGDALSVLEDPFFIPDTPRVPSGAACAAVLAVITVGSLAVGVVALRRRQYALSRIQ